MRLHAGLQLGDFQVLLVQLRLGFLLRLHDGHLLPAGVLGYLGPELGDEFILFSQGHIHGGLFLLFRRLKILLQLGDDQIFLVDILVFPVQFRLVLGRQLGLFHRLLGLMLPVQFLQPALKLGIELGSPDLTDDKGIVGLIDRENVSALGAFQFLHNVMVFNGLKIKQRIQPSVVLTLQRYNK